jgi:hypothetical protein
LSREKKTARKTKPVLMVENSINENADVNLNVPLHYVPPPPTSGQRPIKKKEKKTGRKTKPVATKKKTAARKPWPWTSKRLMRSL